MWPTLRVQSNKKRKVDNEEDAAVAAGKALAPKKPTVIKYENGLTVQDLVVGPLLSLGERSVRRRVCAALTHQPSYPSSCHGQRACSAAAVDAAVQWQ